MKRAISFMIVVVLVLTPVIQISAEYSFIKDLDAIEEAIKSILFIGIFDKDDEIIATGSGFVAFSERTIVTNYHVIEGAQSIYAIDEDDNLYEIDKVLAKDEKTDIAILSIKSGK